MDAFTWWQLCLMIFTLSSALVGGLLFAFSSFVMRGLDQAGPAAAITTMQGINRTVFTPWVMIPFMGTAPFGLILTILAWTMEVSGSPILITLAAAIYIVGVVGVTAFGNVPLNEALDKVDVDQAKDHQQDDLLAPKWQQYFASWTRLNHLRTFLAYVAALLAMLGLIA
jgi:uncharacterized membrane protein